MKDSFPQKTNKFSPFKILVNELVLISLVFSLITPAFLYPLPVKAAEQLVDENDVLYEYYQANPEAVKTLDERQIAELKQTAKKEKRERFLRDKLANVVYVASKESLHYLLNTMAYDIATWLASGDKGQKPMFITQGWGAYLKDVADGAAGMFIQDLSQDWLGFNVCNPSSINLKISIGLGIARTHRPKKPDCSVTELVKNWENFVNDPDFLQKFAPAFDPYGNDIGIAFSMFEKYDAAINKTLNDAIRQREEDQGAKGLIQRISGDILTPSFLVREEAKVMLQKGTVADEKITYGDIFMDAASTFINTLAGKLFERLFKEGLAALSGSKDKEKQKGFILPKLGDLYSPDTAGEQYAGKQTAENRFRDILQIGTKKGRVYDVLSKLTVCADAAKPGPEECVIKPEFRTAIERKLTLKEAIAQGFINGDAPFGFMAYDASAIYRGYPFRSLQILRAYRIVPVGWELAAMMINKFEPQKTYSLNQLIAEYDKPDSLYQGLIDKNWVLILPEHFCKAEGPGPKIQTEELVGGADANGDGDYKDAGDVPPQRNITRQDYCADYQSCLQKNPDGACKYYGYCSEERRIWDFSGSFCPEYFNTCTTFQKSGGNKLVSYLADSLVFNNCSPENAGCRWYCTVFNSLNNLWTCASQGQKVLKPCASAGGCLLSATCDIAPDQTACFDAASNVNLTISAPCGSGSKWWKTADKNCEVTSACTVPKGAVACTNPGCETKTNLLPNAGFETGAPLGGLAANWLGSLEYFRRVSGAAEKIYSGQNSVRFYNAGTAVKASLVSSSITGLKAGTKNYTFSGYVYNKLNAGTITITVNGEPRNAEIKNVWQEISFDFDGAGSVSVEVKVDGGGSPVSGTAWFDRFRISESCVTNPVTLGLVGDYDQAQSKLHLDRDAASCPQDQAGCSVFIRTRAGLGTNLIANGGFEIGADNSELAAKNWVAHTGLQTERVTAGETNKIHSGTYAVKLKHLSCADANCDKYYRVDTPIKLEQNKIYIAAAWIYVEADVYNNIYIDFGQGTVGEGTTNETNSTDGVNKQWRRIYFINNPSKTVEAKPRIVVGGSLFNQGDVYLDDFQVEEVPAGAAYPSEHKEYGSANLTYLKKPPEFLGCVGDYLNDSGQCFDYALYCQPEEVGCDNYTPVLGGPNIPGVAVLQDYCPAECVGYDAYYQSKTMLESQQPLEYFIPPTALACSAANAGCDEFTNLDEAAKGGEGREYYQYLRLCQKPTAAGGNCQNFYAWQGSDEAGYQLKSYSLAAAGSAPEKVVADYSLLPDEWCPSKSEECCNGPEDLALNPFCRELLAIDGTVSYTIYSNTVSCSAYCHPYRKTRRGEGDVIAQTNCTNSKGSWDNAAKICIYQAIPRQGIGCPVQAAGCREYKGNGAGNLSTTFYDTFEDGETAGWGLGAVSSESLSVGGHSIKSGADDFGAGGLQPAVNFGGASLSTACADSLVACGANKTDNCYDSARRQCVAKSGNYTCLVPLGQTACGLTTDSFKSGKSYIVSFWAKSDKQPIKFRLKFRYLATVANSLINIGPEWNYYSFGPFIAPAVSANTPLTFRNDTVGDLTAFYLDNIRVQEIRDFTYIIKNSWQTPVSCDTNPWTDPPSAAPQFMLGCRQYEDSQKRTHNLKSFDHLCREDAAGCEALIDTFNSSSPFEKVYNAEDSIAKVTVPADKTIYLTNRPAVACQAENKGCQPLGLPTIGTDEKNADIISSYQTVFKLNNPDNYDKTLCLSAEAGCEEYQSSDGFAYFKDPGNKTCEFKLPAGQGNEIQNYGWFKSGSAVSFTPDCPLVESPVAVEHPGKGFAGLCPAEFNTCTQFIDPVSAVAKNLVFNPDFTLDLDGVSGPDGWTPSGTTLWQNITLKPNTLYTLAAQGQSNVSVKISGCEGVTSFDQSLVLNQTLPEATAATLNLGAALQKYSGRFMTKGDTQCKLEVGGFTQNAADKITNPVSVAVRQTLLDYVLSNTVDRTGCNGVVDEENGCVLFNDRGGVNYKNGEDDISYLTFEADLSGKDINSGLPSLSCSNNCDSNAVLKVRPDRSCESWLACTAEAEVPQKSGELKNYCLALGLCNSMDEKGNCNNFVLTGGSADTAAPEAVKNLSGYISAGLKPEVSQALPIFTSYADLVQKGGTAKVANSDFEQTFGGRAEPVGWSAYQDNEGWSEQKFRIVADGLNSLEGASYLRLNTFHQAVSEEIDIQRGQNYILTGWVNTLDLLDSDKTQNPKAQICLVKGNNTFIECPVALRVKGGLPWQYVNYEIKANDVSDTDTLKIILQNYSENAGYCRDENDNTPCALGGFSLFDMVSLDPVLTKAPTLAQTGFEPRSCRLFPKAEALSCRYNEEGTLYYGQYGYCLLKDPQNKDQCLQWWPVDQILGEVLEDLPNYSDRAPLYYCLEKSMKTVDISQVGGLARISEQTEGTDYAGFRSLDSGKEVKFVPFNVSDAYRPLFRWPYITRIEFSGLAAGLGAQSSIGGLVIKATMEREKGCVIAAGLSQIGGLAPMGAAGCNAGYGALINTAPVLCEGGWRPGCLGQWLGESLSAALAGLVSQVSGILGAINVKPEDLFFTGDDIWGGWGLEVLVINNWPVVLVLPWHSAKAITFDGLMAIISQVSNLIGTFTGETIIQAGTIGMKIITDEDAEFGGVLPDPVPDMAGDILGAAWFVDSATDTGVYGAVLTGVFSGDLKVQYCGKLAQTVTAAGSNKGWANKLNEGSGYILNENVLDYKLEKLIDYDLNNDGPESIAAVYKYENPFNYEKFLNNLGYQASDYRPFASLVPPDDSQFPSQWDSRPGVSYYQPLYYEPPRTALGRPYQPRLGEVHSVDGLQKLFLKSYGTWQWREGDNNLSSDDRYYRLSPGDAGYSGWDLLNSWQVNGGYADCDNGAGRPDQDKLCRVRPRILNIKVDGRDGAVVKRNKAVKLSFNIKVDAEQLPLKSYVIDWGDGEITSVFGATLRGRENTENPFVFYHPYDYWRMKKRSAEDNPPADLTCDETTCATKLMIKVKDNWNAESCRPGGDCANNEDGKFVPLEGEIRVVK